MKALRAIGVAIGAVGLILLLGWLAWAWNESRLPDRYNAMDFHPLDVGGGSSAMKGSPRSVEQFTTAESGAPDFRMTLIARKATIRTSSGQTFDAWTFNGSVPGPELRVHQHDLVEVTLVNEDINAGVTIHWHGVDVPNSEDGVAGITQDAVRPGERYTYRFRVEQVGTFWYHSHQASSEQVKRGLYGPLVIEPAKKPPIQTLDLPVVVHDFDGDEALGLTDTLQFRTVAPGTPVRLRLVNSNDLPEKLVLSGVPFRVIAIDGTELNGPTPIEGRTLELGAGARYDVAFTMPSRPVRLDLAEAKNATLALSPTANAELPAVSGGPTFDPATYGAPAPTPFDASSHVDRTFELRISRKFGFRDGDLGYQWAVNGKIYPETPMFLVREGELVKMAIRNDTAAVHPMHLHGHHLLVLSRDGRPVTGSPWWVDTLNVHGHEWFEVAFRADNPGLWMDHCHNLPHAAQGLTMHLAYEGVTTPFQLGPAAHNAPE